MSGSVQDERKATTPSRPSLLSEQLPEHFLLENEFLQARISAQTGGKILSLVDRATGSEWLLPPLHPYADARTDGDFSLSDCGGFDECLPGVAESTSVPDHGEVWRKPWQGGIVDGALRLTVETAHPRLRFTRAARLEGRTLALDYQVENLAPEPSAFLWSAHPLLQVEEGDRIVLPSEFSSVLVEYSAGDRIRGNHEHCPWPVAVAADGSHVDLSRVGACDGRTAEKLFAGPFAHAGWCGLYRAQRRQGVIFRFHPESLPFVGLWICHGAWPEGGAHKQYTVAIEPTTADCDSLDRAASRGTARRLEAGGRTGWTVQIEITPAGALDLNAFTARARHQE